MTFRRMTLVYVCLAFIFLCLALAGSPCLTLISFIAINIMIIFLGLSHVYMFFDGKKQDHKYFLSLITHKCSARYIDYEVPTAYRMSVLVMFDENGNPSYEIEKGCKRLLPMIL